MKLRESEFQEKAVVNKIINSKVTRKSEKEKKKRAEKVELYAQLNQQYASYIETLQHELGELNRRRKAQEEPQGNGA